METLNLILSAASAGLALLVALVTFICKFIKAVKTKNTEAAKNLLSQGVTAAVQFAEQLRSKTGSALDGATKKAIAINEVKAFCSEHSIMFDAEAVDEMIESVITLTKTVNANTSSTAATSDTTIEGAEIK